MATMHDEPINYLDSILSEEESKQSSATSCQYNHNWRNFSISRSGRFKSKNRKRNGIDGRFFDDQQQQQQQQQQQASATGSNNGGVSGAMAAAVKEQEKNSYRHSMHSKSTAAATASGGLSVRTRDKPAESYKSFYETNL